MPTADSHAAACAQQIRRRWNERPRVAMILGTGIGDLARSIEDSVSIPFGELPNWPRATALSHKGRVVCGWLDGVPVVATEGRLHLYEGHSLEAITLPVRTMHSLGAKLLIVSNASGGLNPQFQSGDVMLIENHIDLMWQSSATLNKNKHDPCRADRIGQPYDSRLIDQAISVARRADIVAHRGVYIGVTGPCYETRAEYRFFRRIGGDVVGMSTVPEVVEARQCKMSVLGISIVTNVAIPDAPDKVDANDVVDAARQAKPKLQTIVRGILSEAIQDS